MSINPLPSGRPTLDCWPRGATVDLAESIILRLTRDQVTELSLNNRVEIMAFGHNVQQPTITIITEEP